VTKADPSKLARVRCPQDGSDESPTARVARGPSNSLYLSLGEWPRLPFTARIGRLSSFQMILPSSLASLSWNDTRVDPTAAVERAHSDRARSGSKGSARVSFHPFHRARSASTKGTWPLPPLLADCFSILLGFF